MPEFEEYLEGIAEKKLLKNDPDYTPGPFSREDSIGRAAVIKYLKRKKNFGDSRIPPRDVNLRTVDRLLDILNEVFNAVLAGHIHDEPLTADMKNRLVKKLVYVIEITMGVHDLKENA